MCIVDDCLDDIVLKSSQVLLLVAEGDGSLGTPSRSEDRFALFSKRDPPDKYRFSGTGRLQSFGVLLHEVVILRSK